MTRKTTPEIEIGTTGGNPFVLPLDAVTQKLAFLGRTGSGKSYGAMKIAEGMLDAGSQIVVLDPVGIWWGLRLAKDGKSSAYRLPVFGGLRGDIPLESTGGTLIANIVVERRLSVILDVSQFESDREKARFAEAFATRFFFLKKAAPSPVHVFLEECQEFIPQNTQKGEEKMLHAFNRMWKLGRNFGIGGSLISQRPQEVNKKALNMTGCLFAFQMAAPHERKTVRDWASYQGGTADIDKLLPTLAVGHAHIDSPQWLGISEHVQITEKKTYDSSSTPKTGIIKVEVRELDVADLEAIRADLAASIEEAKANDPKELKRRISELESEMRRKPSQVTEVNVEARVREATLPLTRRIGSLEEKVQTASGYLAGAVERFEIGVDLIRKAREALHLNGTAAAAQEVALESLQPRQKRSRPKADDSEGSAPTPRRGEESDLSKPQQKILDALAAYESFGQQVVDRAAACAFAGYKPSSGHINNVISQLKAAELVSYPSGGMLVLTGEGRSLARVEPVHSVEDVHRRWLALCSGPQRKILEVLLRVWPREFSREVLAEETDFSSGSGYFNNLISSLSTLGAVEYPQPGYVKASELLFPNMLPEAIQQEEN